VFADHERAFTDDTADGRPGQPPSADLIEGGGPVRRRRTGLAVAVLSGAALVGFLLTGPSHITHPNPGPIPSSEAEPGPDFSVNRVAFTDADFGYALLSPCRLSASCEGRWSLQRTTDSGRNWHRVASPLDARVATSAAVYARGRHDVALVIAGIRFVSNDAGLTWQKVPLERIGGSVDAVPPGDEIGYYCPADCSRPLSAHDPVEGIHHPLRRQPQLTGDPAQLLVAGFVAADQVWLVIGPLTDAPRILHSVDRGRHWATVPAPAFDDWFDPTLLLAPDGSQVYLATRGGAQAHVKRVWRLTDPVNGRWVGAATDGMPLDTIREIRVLPDGELRYADVAGNAWLTEEDATRVVPAPRPLLNGRRVNINVGQVVDGVVVATPAVGLRGDRVLVSTDSARHWQVHPVPF
jgi:hypothetical protein